MITDIVLYIINAVLATILGIFSLFNVLVPSQVASAFTTLFGYAHIVDSVFPMTDALLAGTFVLTVWTTVYIIKVVLFGYALLPWIGKKGSLPSHGGGDRKTRN